MLPIVPEITEGAAARVAVLSKLYLLAEVVQSSANTGAAENNTPPSAIDAPNPIPTLDTLTCSPPGHRLPNSHRNKFEFKNKYIIRSDDAGSCFIGV